MIQQTFLPSQDKILVGEHLPFPDVIMDLEMLSL